jgi:hypothetical protein
MLFLVVASHLVLACNPSETQTENYNRREIAADFIQAFGENDGNSAYQLMTRNSRIGFGTIDGNATISGDLIREFIDSRSPSDYRIRSLVQTDKQVAVTAEKNGQLQLWVFEFTGSCIQAVTVFE